ncbi:hypothetical protein GJ496_002749 [Pomphorhynchus laevis]|nr:hypothetical protein GJ496_002749 [Pomphorhynchus laevis]
MIVTNINVKPILYTTQVLFERRRLKVAYATIPAQTKMLESGKVEGAKDFFRGYSTMIKNLPGTMLSHLRFYLDDNYPKVSNHFEQISKIALEGTKAVFLEGHEIGGYRRMSPVEDLYFEEQNLVIDATSDKSLAEEKLNKLHERFSKSVRKSVRLINRSEHEEKAMANLMKYLITVVAGPKFDLAISLAMGKRSDLLRSAELIEKLTIENIKQKEKTMAPLSRERNQTD